MDAEQLNQELNLKTVTALGTIISDEERGLITKAQAMTGVRAIYDTVGGLVPTPTFDLISEAVLRYRGSSACEVDFIKRDGCIQGVLRVLPSQAVLRIDRATPHRLPANNTDDADIGITRRQDAKGLFQNMRMVGAW